VGYGDKPSGKGDHLVKKRTLLIHKGYQRRKQNLEDPPLQWEHLSYGRRELNYPILWYFERIDLKGIERPPISCVCNGHLRWPENCSWRKGL